MPFALNRVDSDVIVARGLGDIAAADHEALLRRLAEECDRDPTSRFLLDLSGTTYVPVIDDARSLARRFAQLAHGRRCRIAIVARGPAQYGTARMMGALASKDNLNAAAFERVSDAMDWLREDDSDGR